MGDAGLPGGLTDQQRRPRALRLGGGHWYVVAPGRFEYVGEGDLSEADAKAVTADLAGGVFACVAQPRLAEDVLGEGAWGTRRLRWVERLRRPIRPKLAWVALGARIAVLPDAGAVWVDSERLFEPGEAVPLPWTDPAVSLVVVRPPTVLQAMRAALGDQGPRRATGVPGTG